MEKGEQLGGSGVFLGGPSSVSGDELRIVGECGDLRGLHGPVDITQLSSRGRIYLETIVDQLQKSAKGVDRRLVQYVLIYGDPGEGDRITEYLQACSATYQERLFIFCRERDHFHVWHDCPWNHSFCRCRWRNAGIIEKTIRPRIRRRPPFLSNIGRNSWKAICQYSFFRKGIQKARVCLRSNAMCFECSNNHIHDEWYQPQGGLVEESNSRNECNLYREQSDAPETKRDRIDGGQRYKRARGSFEDLTEKTAVLLNKYLCSPPGNLKFIIPVDSPDFCAKFYDPKYVRQYESAIDIFNIKINSLSLREFRDLYSKTLPVFNSHTLNPFDLYHNIDESVYYLNSLLNFQFNGEEFKIVNFLSNVKRWFDKSGWLEETGLINIKCNTISVVGPPNCGKSYFFDCLASLALNVGHIGRINNKTNHFSLQESVNKRLISGNEISMEEGAKEDFKKICEGSPVNIPVKHQKDSVLYKTPVLLMSNSYSFVNHDPAFKDIRVKTFLWKPYDTLQSSEKKPYPLAMFKIFDMYNVNV